MEKYIPDLYVKSIYYIDYEKLKERGIKCILFDLDNTVAPISIKKPNKKIKDLFIKLKSMGFKLIIFSNSGKTRLKPFKEELEVDCAFSCKKPMRKKFDVILREYKYGISEVVIVGDSGVGKSNLIKRFTTNEFNENSKATVGVEFLSKSYKINDKIFKIEMWDTAGQERYKSITAAYYKGAKGALIVYDTTSEKTFENVDKWLSEIKEQTNKDIKLIIVGNKIDLKDKKVISTEQAKTKAKELGIPLMETSAKDATNVKEAFNDLLKEMYCELSQALQYVEQQNLENKNGIQLDVEEKKKKSCC